MKLLTISYEQFDEAYKADVSKYVEKTYNGIEYLSWPFAIRFLRRTHPTIHVDFDLDETGSVLHLIDGGYAYVRPYLTDGESRTPSLVFPVMDRKHNGAVNPDSRAVSDACQRATVKAIATFTGIGLSLYSGEDVEQHREPAPAIAPARLDPVATVLAAANTAAQDRWAGLAAAIGKWEGQINEYLVDKRKLLQPGQTWRDLPEEHLKIAAGNPEVLISKVRQVA